MYNKDFWRNKDIWRGRKGVSPKEEYWNTTPKAWVLWGKATGLSPERSKSAFNTMVPKNIYTWLTEGFIGQAYGTLSGKEKEEVSKSFIERATETPLLKRIVRKTYPQNKKTEETVKKANKYEIDTHKKGREKSIGQLKHEVEQAEKQRQNKRANLDRKFDQLAAIAKVGNFDSKQELESELKQLKREDEKEYKRVFNRVKRKYPDIKKPKTFRQRIKERRKKLRGR